MTTTVVSPPRVIGTDDVMRILGTGRYETVYERLRRGDAMLTTGYLGKMSGRHIWNAHILLAGMFPSVAELEAFLDGGAPAVATVCQAAGCPYPANYTAGLCYRHFSRLLTKIRRAERSPTARVHLIAMCRWVVARTEHVVVPEFNPFSDVCAADGCDTPLTESVFSPFCDTHLRILHRHPPPTL